MVASCMIKMPKVFVVAATMQGEVMVLSLYISQINMGMPTLLMMAELMHMHARVSD